MKTVKFITAIVAVVLMCVSISAQTKTQGKGTVEKTVTIKVWGNCESCKARIETAAKIDGVIKADWDVNSKLLTLVYKPSKVSSEDVEKKIAAAGHDTEKYTADDKAYNSLPSCCKYDRKK